LPKRTATATIVCCSCEIASTTHSQSAFVAPITVWSHLERIREKTGARNRAELTRYAMQAGIEPVAPSR
jgi:hypothetical protein